MTESQPSMFKLDSKPITECTGVTTGPRSFILIFMSNDVTATDFKNKNLLMHHVNRNKVIHMARSNLKAAYADIDTFLIRRTKTRFMNIPLPWLSNKRPVAFKKKWTLARRYSLLGSARRQTKIVDLGLSYQLQHDWGCQANTLSKQHNQWAFFSWLVCASVISSYYKAFL